eukprot:504783-Amphidinium_carterae.1
MSKWTGLDTPSLFIEDDIAVLAIRSKQPNVSAGERMDLGHNAVLGVNLSTQDELWTYDLGDDVVWNFMPSSVGDGSIIFSNTCGTAYRVNLSNGARIWQAGTGVTGQCGTAGGVLGPNEVFYAAYNAGDVAGVGLGRLAAYHVSDGSKIWDKAMGPRSSGRAELRTFEELGSWQYPAVGHIDGVLAVVTGVGGITTMPQFLPFPRLPLFIRQAWTR